MLFTDSNCCDTATLSSLDPEVQVVADALVKGKFNLPLEGNTGSVCSRAWVECRSKLEAALAAFNCYIGTSGEQGLLAAVNNTGWFGIGTRARLRLSQIVVHDTYYSNSLSPIQQWVAYVALRILFQSAAFHFATAKAGNSDRYDQKAEHYCKQEARLWSMVVSQGAPFVYSYLSAPAALHDFQAGTWSASNLSNTVDVSNTNPADLNIRVAITYYDNTVYVSPSNKGNGESGPSAILEYVLPAGQLLNIDITSLNPPDILKPPPTGLSQGVAPYNNASHWLLYAGTDDPNSPLWLQSTSGGIPIATKQYVAPAALTTSGTILSQGQNPMISGNLIFGNTISRG